MTGTWGNVCRMLVDAAARDEGAPAVVETGATIRYGELAARAAAIAQTLRDLGVRPGDRVGIFLNRGADAAAAHFGVLHAGGVVVPINESLRPRQIEHILADSAASLLLTSARMLERLSRALDSGTQVVDIAAIPATAECDPAARVGSDLAQIIYTSGSTGLPKGVTISHDNLAAGAHAVVAYLGISKTDRIASLLPFSFDYGLNQLFCAVATGATLVVELSPVPQRIVQTLRKSESTVVPAVPPLWLQLLSVESFQTRPIESLRIMTNTGGRLPSEAVRKLRRFQPQANLVLMYGLTEAFRSTYLASERVDHKPDSIGQAIPGAEILVLDEDSRPCPPGEVGELVHRGPTVALGYWNDPEATARVFRPNPTRPTGTPAAERVVFSGDLVYRDEDGDIFFVGRRDRMIKSLGFRVSPDEVTDVLYASDQVADAVVVSEPDEALGERIVAYVVLAANGDLKKLESYCSVEMPRHMRPARIEVRSSLERTPSGKHDAAATARAAGD
jgi:acyl-CoA ligase (AMP-forming) (exosortase A-associated)